MCGSAIMCRPEGHCCLVHTVGPVGIIRDPRNLEIPPTSGKAIATEALQVRSCCNAPPPSGKAITTEALQVRSWLKPNVVWPIRFMHALRI
jgi:hypothetical protein